MENPECQVLRRLNKIGIVKAKISDLRFTYERKTLHLIRLPLKEGERVQKEIRGLKVKKCEGKQDACFWLESEGCKTCHAILSNKSFLVRGYSIGDSRIIYEFIAPSFSSYQKILNDLRNNNIKYRVLKVKNIASEKRVLTPRQERVLWYALTLGYFDYPRRIKTEELARILDMSPSTLSEVLRRGIRRLLEDYFH